MVKILHVGNGNGKHLGARTYDVGRKLQHGLIRLHHDALFFSDRDVARSSGVLGTKLQGKARCNDKLLEVAWQFRPDMLLLGHADIITNETLAEIRAALPDVRMAQFNVDPVFRPENDAAIRHRVHAVDATFVTTGGDVLKRYSAPHHQVRYMPNPVDAAIEVHQCFAHAQLPYDLFYAVRATTTSGSHAGNDRIEIPRYLRREAPELRCHFHGFDGVPELFGQRFYEAIGQCAMGLNLSHECTTKGVVMQATEEEKYLYSSDRIAQYMGCGLLTFTRNGFGLEHMFRRDEVVFFSERDELLELVAYYATNPDARQRIAARCWQKVHEDFSAERVARYIVEVTMEAKQITPVPWDARVF